MSSLALLLLSPPPSPLLSTPANSRLLEVLQEALLKLLRVPFDDTLWVLTKHLHLSPVAVAHLVALEAVLIAALLLAQLAVPAQLLQALGFDGVGNLDRFQGR